MTRPDEDIDRWLRRFHPAGPDAPRLVCFPHAGGSASWYFPVSAALAPHVDVVAIQYPGRQDRRSEAPVDDIVVLSSRIADVLARAAGRPLVFFGHSMGAVVAFEAARMLAARGAAGPVHLFVSGRRAPTRHRDDAVHRRDDRGVLDELKLLSGTDARVFGDDELVRMIMPAVRADYRAIETYRYVPGSPLACSVSALTGGRDPKTSIEEAGAWAELTTGPFDLRVFPGGHFFLIDSQDDVLKLIAERMDAVR